MDDIPGLTADSFKDFGKTIKCMERAPSSGQMAASTRANTSTKRKKGMVCLAGLMVGVMQATGETANKMAKAFTGTRRELRERVFGVTARKLNGLIDIVTS